MYARVLEVEDADTLTVEAKREVEMAGREVDVTETFWLRLRDVDAHETSTEQGKREKKWLEDLLMTQQEQAHYDHPFEIYAVGEGWEKGGHDRKLGSLRDNKGRDLQMLLIQKFDGVLYEPKYGDDGRDEAQDN